MRVERIILEVTEEELKTRILDYLDSNPPSLHLMEDIQQEYIEDFYANMNDYIDKDTITKICLEF